MKLEFLMQNRFLLGNVFLKSQFSEKRFHLLRYGEYVSDEQIADYQKRNLNDFEYEPVITSEHYLPWFNLLNEIKHGIEDSVKMARFVRGLQIFYIDNFLKKELSEVDILSMIEGNIRVFGQGRGRQIIQDFLKSNIILFKRQAFLASSCMIPLFIMGHDDFKFLEDVFVTILLCNHSLWDFHTIQSDRSISYYHQHPLSVEKKDLLKQNSDKLLFDFEQVVSQPLYPYEYDSVAEFIVRHHEWCISEKGSFNPSLINDWMGTIFFFDLIVPYHYEKHFHFSSILKSLNHEQQQILHGLHKIVYFFRDQLGVDVFSKLGMKKLESA